MPDTLTQWALFGFYTLGSAGGLGFIGMWLVVAAGEVKVRRRQRQWNRRMGR